MYLYLGRPMKDDGEDCISWPKYGCPYLYVLTQIWLPIFDSGVLALAVHSLVAASHPQSGSWEDTLAFGSTSAKKFCLSGFWVARVLLVIWEEFELGKKWET